MSGRESRTRAPIVKKSPIHGKGVFANRRYEAGSDVAYFRGYEVDHDTRHSLTLDGRKIEPIGILKYLNHSCDPNCHFRGRVLVTRREVNPGDELTINYCDTEESFSYPFDCNCQCANCCLRIPRSS